ncbi:GL14796 [Drosophila persimilis]|uniref:GL14796 n=1 Tax=Drosophila persimilis TaxID=7234 RepID=B4HA02_DROPE|nr:GL14796 [Drosophila persimilis]
MVQCVKKVMARTIEVTSKEVQGSFLIETENNVKPVTLNFDRLDGWQRVSYLQQLFWSRWKEEYITSLQQRSKWRTAKPSLAVADLVLVKDENLPPMKWPLARVVELLPGRDDVSRVAVLKTSSGITKRAVNKLCLLPLKDAVESQASNGGSMSGQAA